MARGWTTRCCSAFALIAGSAVLLIAQPLTTEPLRLFPVRPAWDLPLNNDLKATPALDGTRGYFPIEGDRVAAYDVHYGTLLWIASARVEWQPTVGDGLVFLVEPGTLTALHDDTGIAAWRFPLTEALAAPLVWNNGWLIGTTAAGTVLAFRAIDGGLIWRQELGALIHGAAALATDRVYVPMADGRIVALREDTGQPLWERRLGAAPNDILALDDRLFVGSNDNYFYAIRTRDGEVLWRWPTGADVIGRPVVDDRRVYFVSLDNVLRGLDRNTGNQRWKRVLPLRPTRGPIAAGDMLIISGISPNVPAYFMKDGTPAGTIPAGGELASSPHMIEGDALPIAILVTRDIAQGTVVRAVTRAVEPTDTAIVPLPNPIVPVAPGEPADPAVSPVEPI